MCLLLFSNQKKKKKYSMAMFGYGAHGNAMCVIRERKKNLASAMNFIHLENRSAGFIRCSVFLLLVFLLSAFPCFYRMVFVVVLVREKKTHVLSIGERNLPSTKCAGKLLSLVVFSIQFSIDSLEYNSNSIHFAVGVSIRRLVASPQL